MFLYRTLQTFAALDIVLRSKAQCPWRPPRPERCLLVCFLSWSPELRGRSRNFCGLWGFPRNNHKKCTRPSFCRDPQRPVHRRFFPFPGGTTIFQDWLPAWPEFSATRDLDGGSCFSRSEFSMCPVVLYVVPMTTLFCSSVLCAWREE